MMNIISSELLVWQRLKKTPGFVITVIATMGLSLGALLSVFTLAYYLIFKPLPYPEQDKLHRVDSVLINETGETRAYTYPGLIHLYENQNVFQKSSLIAYSQQVLSSSKDLPTINTAYVTPEWFSILGAKLILGRYFETSEALGTSNPVAILDYKTWQSEFDGDKNILEKKITFNGVNFQVVGVLAKSFLEPQIYKRGIKTGIWMPWDFNPASGQREVWWSLDDTIMLAGKLKDEYNSLQAQQTITPLVNDKWKDAVSGMDFFDSWRINMELHSFKSTIMKTSESAIWMLVIGIIGLVIIACANLFNLFISRTAQQQHSLSIRAAVGATKGDLFKYFFSESRLLMFISTLIGLLIVVAALWLLKQNMIGVLPRVSELNVSYITIGISLILLLLFSLVFASLGNKMINYQALNQTLQTSGKGTGVQVSKSIRKILISGQVAIAALLIFINANLYYKSQQMMNNPMGFVVKDLYSLTLSFTTPVQPSNDEKKVMLGQALNELSLLPKIDTITRSSSPLGEFSLFALTEAESGEQFTPSFITVSDKYFSMIEQPLVEGDYFSESDIQDRNSVVIVNETFAKQISPQTSALGKHLSPGGNRQFLIRGVVKDISIPGGKGSTARMYRPTSPNNATIIIKLKPQQTITRSEINKVLMTINPNINVHELRSLVETRDRLLFSQKVVTMTSATIAILSLILAAIGLYGIMNYSAQMRRFEFGTRLAIGARSNDLIKLITLDNLPSIMFGLVSGIIILLIIYLGFSDMLAEYTSVELVPATIVTIISIAIITIIGLYLPIRRFLQTPVINSLRGND